MTNYVENIYSMIAEAEGGARVSVVIIGGNERMRRQYEEICRTFGCRAKVYTKERGAMKKKIGTPDLLICFTGTVSHKMANVCKQESQRGGFPIEHCHSSSGTALAEVLKTRTGILEQRG